MELERDNDAGEGDGEEEKWVLLGRGGRGKGLAWLVVDEGGGKERGMWGLEYDTWRKGGRATGGMKEEGEEGREMGVEMKDEKGEGGFEVN